MNSDALSLGTWNILGDNFHRNERLSLVACEIQDLDLVAIQEAVFPRGGGSDTAHTLAELTGMRVASLVPGGIENRVSGDPQATAILTNLDIIESDISVIIPEEVDELYQDECGSYAGALVKAKSGRPIFIISCHLPWGGERESRRLFHIKHINSFIMSALAKFPSDTICILAGDFNTTPISDSLRFLRGELSDETNASFWVDVWDVNEHGPGNTFDPKSGNTSLFRTAFESGIRHPEQMPPRRLDYILIKGWVYGRPGSPMGAQIMGTKPGKTGVYASDHFGLKALLWDPSG